LSNNETYLSMSLHSRGKSIAFYSRIMAITRSDELGLSPAARDTKLSSRAIAIIIRSLNNILFHIFRLFLSVSKHISIILREVSVIKM
jgi:hypothetical protein